MLVDILIWLYFINATLLMLHEIDSAYWHEWKLFGVPGGMNGFLVFNLIAILLALYGFIEIVKQTTTGFFFSLFMAIVGVFTFGIHMYFLKKGRNEFRVPISITILILILVVSLAQLFFIVCILR
jgi:type IV secretory pathway VirB2 component (pilin)